MSWQTYVDKSLVGGGKISRAAILGQQGGVWAASPGYNLSPAEQAAVLSVFTDQTKATQSGVTLAGQKFFTLQVDDKALYGKKLADGVIIMKTVQAIIVGEFVAPTQAPEAVTAVSSIVDHLVREGY